MSKCPFFLHNSQSTMYCEINIHTVQSVKTLCVKYRKNDINNKCQNIVLNQCTRGQIKTVKLCSLYDRLLKSLVIEVRTAIEERRKCENTLHFKQILPMFGSTEVK